MFGNASAMMMHRAVIPGRTHTYHDEEAAVTIVIAVLLFLFVRTCGCVLWCGCLLVDQPVDTAQRSRSGREDSPDGRTRHKSKIKKCRQIPYECRIHTCSVSSVNSEFRTSKRRTCYELGTSYHYTAVHIGQQLQHCCGRPGGRCQPRGEARGSNDWVALESVLLYPSLRNASNGALC